MAYSIVVAGGSIYRVDTSGVATALTLPTGITVSTTRRPRMAVLGRNVYIANAPLRSLMVTPDGTVRPMQLQPPLSAPILAASAGAGNLTGSYNAKFTYCVKDPDSGALLLESAYSQVSNSVTIASKLIDASGITASPDALRNTFRRLYRPTTGPGSTYFRWIDLDGNEKTTLSDDSGDIALSVIASPTELGVAPGMVGGTFMTLLASWKNRLFGVGNDDPDTLRYSGNGIGYGWPATYGVSIPPIGNDIYGVTALAARKDEFGIARRDYFHKLTVVGTNSDGSPNFDRKQVKQGKGCWGSETMLVIDDIAYFLGEDGVYTWGPDGFNCISDLADVRKWFASDDYFNKGKYVDAFAKYNPRYHGYELHLAAAGSSVIDRWVFYDISGKKFYGPHKTAAFTPTAGGIIVDTNGIATPLMGASNGFMYLQNRTTFNDDGSAIAVDLITKKHDGNTPGVRKLWKQWLLANKLYQLAGNLTVTGYVGTKDATANKTFVGDLRLENQNFSHLGEGEHVQLQITESTLNQGCELFGYEIPFHELGQRRPS